MFTSQIEVEGKPQAIVTIAHLPCPALCCRHEFLYANFDAMHKRGQSGAYSNLPVLWQDQCFRAVVLAYTSSTAR